MLRARKGSRSSAPGTFIVADAALQWTGLYDFCYWKAVATNPKSARYSKR
jgi:hypothetical protein